LAGDLGFADAGEVKFPDLACLFPYRQRPSQVLCVEPGFGNTGADSLAEDFVLELSETESNPAMAPGVL
jgi:hypothetical protein